RIEVHLILDHGRRPVGSRGEHPGAFFLLQVAADAVEVDTARPVIVGPEDVANRGQEPGIADLLLDVLPASVRGAVNAATALEPRNEQSSLATVGHHCPHRFGPGTDEDGGADPSPRALRIDRRGRLYDDL